MPIKKRRCPACGKSKKASEFYRQGGRPHGYCKPCAKGKERERHREKVVAEFGQDELDRRDKVQSLRKRVKKGQKLCNLCLIIKKLDQFYGRGDAGVDPYCKPCRRAYDKRRAAKSPRHRLVTLHNAARNRAVNNGWEFDLRVDQLLGLWDQQEGRCFYSKVPLKYDGKRKPEALSLDRMDSKFGYTMQNVILCCRRINEMKREMTISDFRRWCELVVNETKE